MWIARDQELNGEENLSRLQSRHQFWRAAGHFRRPVHHRGDHQRVHRYLVHAGSRLHLREDSFDRLGVGNQAWDRFERRWCLQVRVWYFKPRRWLRYFGQRIRRICRLQHVLRRTKGISQQYLRDCSVPLRKDTANQQHDPISRLLQSGIVLQ